jgi:tetratricopeptide (TPR) repeat protein
VYGDLIAPAVTAAAMDVIRADQEQIGGTIHKPMFERLMLCDYAIADVTGANPNVYYELGVRHAIRPRSTVIIFAEKTALPFDIVSLRGIPYAIDANGGLVNAEQARRTITAALDAAHQDSSDDSPVYQLIDDMPRYQLERGKTDIFRSQVDYSRALKARLAQARAEGLAAVKAAMAEIPKLNEVEAGIVMDLLLSFRHFGTTEGYEEMVSLYGRMPKPLQHARIAREQYAFALNRLRRFQQAEAVLRTLIDEFGDNSETNGLLGRVYKDQWEIARDAGNELEAESYLRRSIEAYRRGFESDWRDTYPGINAVTTMEMLDEPCPEQADLIPVVHYAALQRARANGDYWDFATLLEIAVLGRNHQEARRAAAEAITRAKEPFALKSTVRNLSLVRKARQRRGEDAGWIVTLEDALRRKANELEGGSEREARS